MSQTDNRCSSSHLHTMRFDGVYMVKVCEWTVIFRVLYSGYSLACSHSCSFSVVFRLFTLHTNTYTHCTQQSNAPRQLISTFMTYFKNTLGLICAFHLTFCYLAKYQIRARRLNRRLWFLCACYFNWDITTMSVSHEGIPLEQKVWPNKKASEKESENERWEWEREREKEIAVERWHEDRGKKHTSTSYLFITMLFLCWWQKVTHKKNSPINSVVLLCSVAHKFFFCAVVVLF